MKFREYEAPCGRLLVGVRGRSVCLCDWDIGPRIDRSLRRIHKYMPPCRDSDDEALLGRVAALLDGYFEGRNEGFDVPLAPYGSPFQQRVWDVLRRVPYGETSSYKAIAEAAGLPGGARATAAAIGANPLSILIPCHRIIASDGGIGGYAGGIDAKRYLLQLECQLSGKLTH